MPLIASVTARQILDSRGVPTVEATVTLDNGVTQYSSVPSGSISNKIEAVELRDHINGDYFGQGVLKAVENVNTVINQKIAGMDPLYQTQVDQALVDLDGTTNKSRLGSNAIMAVSQAVLKAAAASLNLPIFMYVKEKYQMIDAYRIPTPIFNLINGGRHGSGALDFQEFQLVPASHLPYSKALQIGAEVFMALEKVLEQKGAIRTVGMEGGYAPNLATNTDALEIFSEAIKMTSYQLAQDAFLGIDVAPRWFHKSGKYNIKDRPQPLDAKTLIKFFQDLHHQYRVFSFEDPLLADSWNDWKFMTAEVGETAMVVADDLVSTNKTLLMKAIQEKACNAIVIKPNRAGTITETIEVISIAKKAGWHTIMSHRSGETTDTLMADLAVGVGTDYAKFGATSRGERVVKYNRLLRIEETLLRSSQSTSQSTGVTTMEPNQQPTTAPAVAPEPPAMPVTPTEPAMPAPMPAMPTQPVVEPAPTVTAEPAQPAAPAIPPTPTDSTNPMAGVFAAPAPVSSPFAPTGLPATPTTPVAPVVPAAPPAETTAPATPSFAPAPTSVETSTPVPAPTLSVSPEPTATTTEPVTPPSADELQSSLDQLAQMVGQTPAAPVPTETNPAPVAAPTTPPAAFPAGLTPPTPPTES